jgi:glycerol-3-phosphate acyltransferase PlsY
MISALLLAAVAGYLLGAIPVGYLVARAKGVNIFEVGSKNPGATNVKRVLGKGPGNLVFVLDAFKGALATFWPVLLSACSDMDARAAVQVVGLIAALLGHSYSCFTGFRGGKGVASAAGGFAVILPIPTLLAATLWLIAFYATRYVSLASILAAITIPVASIALGRPMILNGVAVCIALFVILRHRSNIVRLFNGTEHKFEKKPLEEKNEDVSGE